MYYAPTESITCHCHKIWGRLLFRSTIALRGPHSIKSINKQEAWHEEASEQSGIISSDDLLDCRSDLFLKDVLVNRAYHGLGGKIKINEYGDATKKYFFSTVKNGRLISPD